MNCAEDTLVDSGTNNTFVKIGLICFRNVIKLTVIVANPIQQLNQHWVLWISPILHLPNPSGDFSHVSECWSKVLLNSGQCQVKTAAEPQVLLVAFFKHEKMPNAPNDCDDCIHSNLFSICYTLTSHLYLFSTFFFLSFHQQLVQVASLFYHK